MEEGRTSGDAAAEALGDSGRGLEDSAAPVDRGEPDLPFVLDRDGGRHTQPEQGQLLGKIETVTAKSDGGGHAVIGRKSGMVLARGETREAADQAARRLAAQLGRRRLQARIDAEPARPQEQLREQLQERDPEASLGGDDGLRPQKTPAQPEPEASSAPSGEGLGASEGFRPAELKRGSREVRANDENAIQSNKVQGGSPKKSRWNLPEPTRRLIEAGNEFNRSRRPHYPHNELEVLDAVGNKFRVDSYHPEKGEIISRKFSQLVSISAQAAIGYLRELKTKYPSGAIISHSVFNHKHLRGERISGRLILEVPIQSGQVPRPILDFAKRNNIQIRDINGVIH